MGTYAQWRAKVILAYRGGDASRDEMLMAVKDYARSVMVRDVESDLALSKSYDNSYDDARVRLAGTELTGTIGTILAEVKALMPIDTDTDASLPMLNNAITAAVADWNGAFAQFNALLVSFAQDLQRHVPFYQVRQLTTWIESSTDLTQKGFVSRIPFPTDGRLQQIWYGHYYAPLAAGAYAVDDIVESNNRLYQNTVAGTVVTVGGGLTSTDGTAEELDDTSWVFYSGDYDFPVRAVDWNSRNHLLTGGRSEGPLYALAPQCDEIWLYPILDDAHRFDVEWVGVANSFADLDDVTFDQIAADAAAQGIKSVLLKDQLGDFRGAAAALAMYQKYVRTAVVDNQARDTGSPSSVAPYDWRRRGGFCRSTSVSCCVATESSSSPSNSEHETENTTGYSDLIAQSANHLERVTFSGAASARGVILDINRQLPSGGTIRCLNGDRFVILATFAAAAMTLDVRNSTLAGTQVVTYTAGAAGEQIRFEFFYDAATGEWTFLPP